MGNQLYLRQGGIERRVLAWLLCEWDNITTVIVQNLTNPTCRHLEGKPAVSASSTRFHLPFSCPSPDIPWNLHLGQEETDGTKTAAQHAEPLTMYRRDQRPSWVRGIPPRSAHETLFFLVPTSSSECCTPSADKCCGTPMPATDGEIIYSPVMSTGSKLWPMRLFSTSTNAHDSNLFLRFRQ